VVHGCLQTDVSSYADLTNIPLSKALVGEIRGALKQLTVQKLYKNTHVEWSAKNARPCLASSQPCMIQGF